jgi:hypothetical protein
MYTYQKRSIVLRLANSLVGHGIPFGTAQKMAWNWIKAHSVCAVTFRKVNGEITSRIVAAEHISDHIIFTGTGHSTKPRKLMLDLSKHLAGKNAVISTYPENILHQEYLMTNI